MGDITFKLSTNGRRGGVDVTPAQLKRLSTVMYQETYTELGRIGQTLLFDLKFYFYKMIHERPRNPDYERGRSEPLLSRMRESFKYQLTGDDWQINVNVFDLQHIDEATRNEGFNTAGKGWFMRFADGHSGRKHGAVGWGFIDHDYAMKLAREAANLYINDDSKKQAWLIEMDEVFKGRHGDGLMVRLDRPLFNLLPEFGLAGKYVEQHPGFASWPAIGLVGQQMVSKDGFVANMIQAAFDRAVSKL